jgi:acyl dehydratase
MTNDQDYAVYVGLQFPALEIGPISRTDLVRYAGASGDFNPMHHDDGYAMSAGNPSVFSMGMYQGSILGAYAASCLGPGNIRGFALRFRERVWPGDVIRCEGSVVEIEPSEDGYSVAGEFNVRRQNGEIAVSARARFFLGSVDASVSVGSEYVSSEND